MRLTEQETAGGRHGCRLAGVLSAGVLRGRDVYNVRLLQMAEKQFPEPSNLGGLLTSIEQAQEIRYASLQRAIRRAARAAAFDCNRRTRHRQDDRHVRYSGAFDALKIKTQLAAPTGRGVKAAQRGHRARSVDHSPALEAQFDEATGMMSFTTTKKTPEH